MRKLKGKKGDKMSIQVGIKTPADFELPAHVHSALDGGLLTEDIFADKALSGSKIADGAIATLQVADDLDGAKLQDGSITDIKVDGLAAGDKLLSIPAADVTLVEAMTTPKVHIEDDPV